MKSPLLILAICLTLNLALKIWKLSEPIETDLMVYCMGGHAIFNGLVLYKDLLEQKPPLLHLIYGIFEKIFGYGESQIYAVNLFFSSLIVIIAARILNELAISKKECLFLLIFLIMGLLSSLEIEANMPNSELLINGFLGIILLQSIKICNQKKINTAFFIFVSAALTFIKQHAIFPALFLALANDKSHHKEKAFLPFTIGTLIWTSVFWAGFFFFYYVYGHFYDMWMSLFAFNLTYNASFINTLRQALEWQNGALLAITYFGPALIYFNKKNKNKLIKKLSFLSILFTTGSFIMIALPGKWWPHYYQLMIWPLFYSVALLFCNMRNPQTKMLKYFQVSIFIFCFVLCFYNFFNYLKFNPDEISIKKYKGPWFIETKKVAPQLKKILKDDEWFFVWGQDPGLYVYTKIWPKTRINTYFPFIFGGIQKYAYEKFFDEVSKNPPELVVFPRPQIGMIAPNLADPVLQWICNNYFPISNGIDFEGYLVLAKSGGDFDKRFNQEVSRKTLKEYLLK